jgi:hypothetical protein
MENDQPDAHEGRARRLGESERFIVPVKSNSPSGTLQIRVFSSSTVSFSFPMISRR